MTKNNNKIKIASLIVTVTVIFVIIVTTWAGYGNDIENNVVAIEKLDNEGCKPTQKFELVEYRLNSIDKKMEGFSVKQEAMRKANEESFKKILFRLPK